MRSPSIGIRPVAPSRRPFARSVWSARLPDLAALLFISFTFMTICEPFLFRSVAPAKNYVLFVLALIGLAQLFRQLRRSFTAKASLAFFAAALAALAFQHAYVADAVDSLGRSAQGFVLSLLLYSGLCFAAGGALPLIARSRLAAPLGGVASLAAAYLFFANSEGWRIWWGEILYPDGSTPNHLSVDGAVSALLFLAFAAFRSRFRYFFAAILLICLFINGSRASIFIGAMTLIAAEILSNRYAKKWVYGFYLAIIVSIFAIVSSDFIEIFLDKMFPQGLSGDESYQARNIILTYSWQDLPGQFWAGDPALIVHRFGSIGSYIHNLLSAWQFYGFPSFVCVVLAVLSAAGRALRFDYRHDDGRHIFGLLLLLYAFLGVMTAKYIGVNGLWFALGYWSVMGYSQVARRRPNFRRRPASRMPQSG